jgi:uncharacterized membrane protein
MAVDIDTGRLEAFSDGVFAIAITLLVLEISIPEEEFGDLWRAIADQWPSYLAYVTSFLTIGGLWLVHHGIFRRMRSADLSVLYMNLLLLMLVSFLPFPTGLMADGLGNDDAERAAVISYGVVLLAISVAMTAIGRHVAQREELRAADVARSDFDAVISFAVPSIAFYGLMLLFALLAPHLAAFGFLLVAVLPFARVALQR